MRIALACLLLLAPEEAWDLKYKFTKGMSYEDVQTRVFELEVTEAGRRFVWHNLRNIHMRRTILEVDDTAHPKSERVHVIAYNLDVKASPKDEELGIKREPSEGKTFIWKRLKKRWGLFDDTGEVTVSYRALVEHLKNWRDQRLPKKPIALGKSWEIPPKKFLQTAGLKVPPDVKGVARFKLQKVVRGIATIPFELRYQFTDSNRQLNVEQKGVWEFDAKRGRDLSFTVDGSLLINNGDSGKGKIVMRRKVTYSR